MWCKKHTVRPVVQEITPCHAHLLGEDMNMGTTVPDYVGEAIEKKALKMGLTKSKYLAHIATEWVDNGRLLEIKEGA